MNQIPGSGQRRVCVRSRQTSIGVEPTERDARKGLAIDDAACIFRRPVSPVSSRRQQRQIRMACDQFCGDQREVLIAPAAARVFRQLDGRFATPDTHLCFVEMQLVRKPDREPHRITVKTLRGPADAQAAFSCCKASRLDSMIDGGDDRALYAVISPTRGPHQSRSDDAWIVARHVRYEQRTRLAATQAGRQPPAFEARDTHATSIELADRYAFREPLCIEFLEIGERHSLIEHFDEARRSTRDQEQRLGILRELIDPAQQTRTRREGAFVGDRMCAFVNLDSWKSPRFRRHMAILGDQQYLLDRGAQRVMGAERHGRGCLADGSNPHAPLAFSARVFAQSTGDAQAPVDARQPGLK